MDQPESRQPINTQNLLDAGFDLEPTFGGYAIYGYDGETFDGPVAMNDLGLTSSPDAYAKAVVDRAFRFHRFSRCLA